MAHRRKSVAVEARQLTAAARESIVEWVRGEGVMTLDEESGALVILTPAGTSRAVLGSWVIHDPVCGFEVCQAAAFDARFYESGGSA